MGDNDSPDNKDDISRLPLQDPGLEEITEIPVKQPTNVPPKVDWDNYFNKIRKQQINDQSKKPKDYIQ